jgi:hypothetical protein
MFPHSVGCGMTRLTIGYAMHSSRSNDAVIRVYDDAGNVIETHGHKGGFERVGYSPSYEAGDHPRR